MHQSNQWDDFRALGQVQALQHLCGLALTEISASNEAKRLEATALFGLFANVKHTQGLHLRHYYMGKSKLIKQMSLAGLVIFGLSSAAHAATVTAVFEGNADDVFGFVDPNVANGDALSLTIVGNSEAAPVPLGDLFPDSQFFEINAISAYNLDRVAFSVGTFEPVVNSTDAAIVVFDNLVTQNVGPQIPDEVDGVFVFASDDVSDLLYAAVFEADVLSSSSLGDAIQLGFAQADTIAQEVDFSVSTDGPLGQCNQDCGVFGRVDLTSIDASNAPVAPVPVPAPIGLMFGGLVALGATRLKRRS